MQDAAPHQPVDFGRYYFAHDCGRPYERNEYWLDFFDQVAKRLVRDLHPESVLDAGCAMGLLVEKLRELDVEAWGIDISEFALEQVHDSVREFCHRSSLTEPLSRKYDLVTCIEVLEHMPSADAESALENLCSATNRVLFSSSPFDYREPTHVNVRPPEDWSALFAKQGFVRDLDFDGSFLTPWAALYERSPMLPADVIRAYDRAWWQLRNEVQQVRDSALELQRRLEGAYTDPLLEENLRLREELLTTRDAAIGNEVSLGEALGTIEMLRADLHRYRLALDEHERLLGSRTGRILRAYHRLRALLNP